MIHKRGGNLGVYPLVPLPGRQDSVRFASDNFKNKNHLTNQICIQKQKDTSVMAYRGVFSIHLEMNGFLERIAGFEN